VAITVEPLEKFQNERSMKRSTDIIKRLLIKNPNLTPIQLQEMLARKGLRVEIWTVSYVRRNFLADIRIIQNCGHWVDVEGEPIVHVRRPVIQCGWLEYSEWCKRHLPRNRKPFRPWRFSG
jgi:hypothetical protein